ncbi:membrane protein insertase YidC [Cohnella sp. GCM10027633]|uniref:membrane protein insertase YidC n=1 Tax=unclassified Cohnella TaxID=2636738 RepID=UPI00362C217D
MIRISMSKKRAKLALLAIGVIAVLLLSGCSAASQAPIESALPGLFNHYFIYPFSSLIKVVANAFHGDYGLSIILMTFLIRIALLPLVISQTKKQISMRGKMAELQPELNAIREKYKNDTRAEAKQRQQAEELQLYQKHRFNPLNVGCLPMLLQWPITLAFYYAIRRTPEIAAHDFLWFSLGEPDIMLSVIAAAAYYVQFRVSQSTSASAQARQNPNRALAFMGGVFPIMMGMFSLAMPAALPLYWATGAIFMTLQTIVLNKRYARPTRRSIAEEIA